MQRRKYESPMDWEYQQSTPTGPSPFSEAFQRTRNVTSGESSQTPSIFTPLKAHEGRESPTPFRNPAFPTPRKPIDADVFSKLPDAEDSPPNSHQFLRFTRPSSRSSTHRRRGRSSAARRQPADSTESDGSEEQLALADSVKPARKIDFERADRSLTKETETPVSSDQLSLYGLSLLVILYIGGSFYYKVVSVSVLLVWVYSSYIFPSSSHVRQTARLHIRFLKWTVGLIKVVGLLILLSWCIILSPVHIFIPTLMDAWTTYSDHPIFRSFEVLHDPGEASIVDVFAIHGLGSNPLSAWRHADNGTEVYWLRDLLPKHHGLENIKVTMLNHQTRWDSHSPDVDFDIVAKMMLDDIEHLHEEHRPIIFIAHSFGGLLLKRSLVLATTRSKHIPQMTKGILFFGVPHQGTKAAFIASLLACTAYWRGSSTAMLEYTSGTNPAIATLDKEFYEAYGRPSRIHDYSAPYICNFLEMRPESFGRLSLKPTVNINPGSLRYAEDVLLDSDHRGLNKFQSLEDPNFEKFLRHFDRAFREAMPKGNPPDGK